jgi:hypothetical protein
VENPHGNPENKKFPKALILDMKNAHNKILCDW